MYVCEFLYVLEHMLVFYKTYFQKKKEIVKRNNAIQL